jgi:diguanylate cyclase (GGDEF)-like protein
LATVTPFRPGDPRAGVLFVGGEDDGSRVAAKLEGAWPGRFAVAIVPALTGAEARLLSNPVACLLLDVTVDDGGGLAALERLRLVAPDTPVVLLEPREDEVLEAHALHEGAQDLLPIDTPGEALGRAIRHAIDRKQRERALADQALHDDLTGLPNRVLFMDRLELALTRARRTRSAVCVLFLDLDGFKEVNDTLGHQAGDHVLAEVARRLTEAVRAGDTVARFGGDEFIVLSADATSAIHAEALAFRLGEAISRSFAHDGSSLEVTASIGIAVSRGAEDTAEDLVRRADGAMYRAKATPGPSCEVARQGAGRPDPAR